MMSNRDIDTRQPKVGTECAEQRVRRIVNCPQKLGKSGKMESDRGLLALPESLIGQMGLKLDLSTQGRPCVGTEKAGHK